MVVGHRFARIGPPEQRHRVERCDEDEDQDEDQDAIHGRYLSGFVTTFGCLIGYCAIVTTCA